MQSRTLHFSTALLPGGWAHDVAIDIDANGMISAVRTGEKQGECMTGVAVPGMPNVHSHAHQRLMTGLAERAGPGTDSFWTWRETMYGFALKLSPDDLEAVAGQLYVEMLKSGFTAVGEFQYLHHQPDGSPYANSAELSLRCLHAALEAGIAPTLIPTLYTSGGFGGQPVNQGQRRFANSVDGYLRIHDILEAEICKHPAARLGVSPHSLRAVTPNHLKAVLSSIGKDAPVHIHVAEQVKEVEDCIAWSGRRPVEFLLDTFETGSRWCAIHATHMTGRETSRLARSSVVTGLCPTTEANLGDGIFPAVSYLAQGGAVAVGSDSQISVSPAEDMRMLEYSQRLRDRSRNVLAGGPGQSTGRNLFEAVLAGGAKALAQPMGALKIGCRADIVVIDDQHPAIVGRAGDAILDAWIFSAGNSCIRHVFAAGRHLVKDYRHTEEHRIFNTFKQTTSRLMS